MYVLQVNHDEVPIIVFHFKDDVKWSIPIDANNRDYQEYLAWLKAGNEPTVEHLATPPVSDEPTPEERLAALELVVSMVFAEDDANV
jgi:hypothetical protein